MRIFSGAIVLLTKLLEYVSVWKNISLPFIFIFLNDGEEGIPNRDRIMYRIHHCS